MNEPTFICAPHPQHLALNTAFCTTRWIHIADPLGQHVSSLSATENCHTSRDLLSADRLAGASEAYSVAAVTRSRSDHGRTSVSRAPAAVNVQPAATCRTVATI